MKLPAPSLPRYWADLCTTDFARIDTGRAVAVLPVAATEQHGPHLPLTVDAALADAMLRSSLPHLPPDLPVFFLPTQTVGYSPEHMAFPGTLSWQSGTVIRLWTELAECVAASGIRKLLVFNTHGGNVGLLDVVARDLRNRLHMLVYTSSWWQLPLGDALDVFGAHELRFGVHGGDMETSLMLAIAPHSVRMDAAQHFASSSEARAQQFALLGNGHSAKLAWAAQDYNPHGAMGNAASATAHKGQQLLAAIGQSLARMLVEIDQLPADTLRQC